jgi:hypothetical protein
MTRRIYFRICSGFLLSVTLFVAANLCAGQPEEALCRAGNGNFAADFRTRHVNASVHIGATNVDGFGTRTCEATLTSGDQKVAVASGAWSVDLDALGAELGTGVPVAAFLVKKSESECCGTYFIYSLEKPPRLLRTMSGGSLFEASDVDFDSRVEIWTDDAAAVDGFENLSLAEFDFAPPIVLRFDHGQLLEVSAEFLPYFDHLIADRKAHLDAKDLKDFKASDGRLAPGTSLSPEQRYRLRKVKVGILEIVWAYLYSGREREAWSGLAEMWPTADADRIQAAIAQAREHGIGKQVDGVEASPAKRKKHGTIYDVAGTQGDESEIVSPRPILLRRPAPASDQLAVSSETMLTLIIDSAGKVREVEQPLHANPIDADLTTAAMKWKFIPAIYGGHAVASRTHLAVATRK